MIVSVLGDIKELAQRRAVIGHFVSAELKTGHRDKVLGNLWQLIDPLTFMLVFYVVWSIILGRRGPDFMAYLLSGIVTFQMFQDSVIASSSVLKTQVRLIREVYFPKAALPTAVTLARLYDFAWALGALGLLLVYLIHHQSHATPAELAKIEHPISFGWHVIWLLFAVAILFMFSLGCAYLSAIAGALFRDTPNILAFVFRIWFYLSPLFYYPEEVQRNATLRKVYLLYRINPFTHYFRLIRGALIYNEAPTLDGTLYIVGVSVLALVIGFAVFSRYESVVIKQL